VPGHVRRVLSRAAGFGYDLRAFLRNRQSQFFTLALPVLFLVIFASVFGGSGKTTQVAGGQISTSVYYVPGIIALGVIAACFGNLVASVTAQRERGVLKRRRATPVPAAAVIAGRVLTAVVIAVVMAAVLLGIGWAAYGAHVPGRTALALAVTVVIGAASFCCLGYALTSLIRNEDAALPPPRRSCCRSTSSPGCSSPSRYCRTGWRTWERSSLSRPVTAWAPRPSAPAHR
jgi:ABC-2 type transport system permease protein